MARTLTHKIVQGRDELRVCFSRGASLRDRLALVRDTARFHLGNQLDRSTSLDGAKAYRLRVALRSAEIKLRPHAGDFFVFHEVFTGGYYTIPQQWRQRIRTVVDLGAHVGLTALYLLEILPNARIVCVEPAPDNAELLRRNLAAFADRALVLETAVGPASGRVPFERSGRSWERRIAQDGHEGQPVRCESLDEIMRLAGLSAIDLLKVDIEGAEEVLFERAGSWLDSVRMIIIELHQGYSFDRFSRRVQRAGFRVVTPQEIVGNLMIIATRD